MYTKLELKSNWAFVFTSCCCAIEPLAQLVFRPRLRAFLRTGKGLLARMGAFSSTGRGAGRDWRTWQRSQNQSWVLMSLVVTLGSSLSPKTQIMTKPWLRLGVSRQLHCDYLACLTKDFLAGCWEPPRCLPGALYKLVWVAGHSISCCSAALALGQPAWVLLTFLDVFKHVMPIEMLFKYLWVI